jgi:hypothetical protein
LPEFGWALEPDVVYGRLLTTMTPGKCLVCAIEIPITKPYQYACDDCSELITAFVDACERAGGTLEIDTTAARYVDSKDAGVQLLKKHFLFVAVKLQELVEEINNNALLHGD